MNGEKTAGGQHGSLDLAVTPIHLGDRVAVPIDNFNFDGPSFVSYIEAHCPADDPQRLMFIEASPVSWGAWECHTEGDEIVIVLEGEGTFLQKTGDAIREIAFGPGTAIINPRGVWHTADVAQPMKAIYVTPCPGTEHDPR